MIIEFLLSLLKSYLILTFIYLVVSIIRMYAIRRRVCVKEKGNNRLSELTYSGRYKCIQFYSPEDCKRVSARSVVRLHFMPSDNPVTDRFILICPGGGYAHLDTPHEGYPVAASFNEKGYHVFILEYRTGIYCSDHAPMEDLACALRYIAKNSGEYQVNPNDYLLCGFSAGGNLVGIFGTKRFGYELYGVPKPAGLILGYPWTNINHWTEHPYWNIWVGLFGVYLSERGNLHMFGMFDHFNKDKRDSLCVQKWIDEDYPPTYMFACSSDVLVPCGAHTDVLEISLKEHNVNHQYEKFFRLPHGIGLGIGTTAEVWVENALKFLN